jgi:hypothetical protein
MNLQMRYLRCVFHRKEQRLPSLEAVDTLMSVVGSKKRLYLILSRTVPFDHSLFLMKQIYIRRVRMRKFIYGTCGCTVAVLAGDDRNPLDHDVLIRFNGIDLSMMMVQLPHH